MKHVLPRQTAAHLSAMLDYILQHRRLRMETAFNLFITLSPPPSPIDTADAEDHWLDHTRAARPDSPE